MTVERPGTIIKDSTISHKFLTQYQPVDCTILSEPNTFFPGIEYRFPFEFVVPECLLPSSCTHHKRSWSLEQAHTSLPPTLGDPLIIGDEPHRVEDLAPPMCRVSYMLKATVTRSSLRGNNHSEIIAAVGKKVRIIPAVNEDPPLNIADDSAEYRTKKEVVIKQGLRRNKCGQLTVSGTQPRPLELQLSSRSLSTDIVGTVATLNLRFNPMNDELPPQFDTISSKLQVLTYLAVEPSSDFPTNYTTAQCGKMTRRTYHRCIPLLSLQIGSARWEKHTPSRYGSSNSSSGSPFFPQEKTYYTMPISIPIIIPNNKSFVPTFHSCFLSRVYALDLAVSYFTLNRLKKTASLRVPVQITCRKGIQLPGDSPRSISPATFQIPGI